MMLQSLAEANRLRTKRDACGDLYIPGRIGQSQIYEYASGRLAVTVMPDKSRIWPNAKRKLTAAGFEITQDGDWEGTALFDPGERKKLLLALKLIRAERIRRYRRPSERQLDALRNGRKNTSAAQRAAPDSSASAGRRWGHARRFPGGRKPAAR